MKYQKYPAQTIKVAGDLRRAPATFENPDVAFLSNTFVSSFSFKYIHINMNRFGKLRQNTEEMYRHTDMAANLSEHDVFAKANAPICELTNKRLQLWATENK